tara:strand:+ start:26135 stop:26464 length:330 start_codon:yes stop_codon:yes gene_type:complete
MKLENIKTIDAEVLSCPADRSPIFLVDIEAKIKLTQKDKIPINYKFERILAKGTIEQIKRREETKKQLLKIVFKGRTNEKKYIKDFDLSLINIKEVSLIKFIGYGIKSI